MTDMAVDLRRVVVRPIRADERQTFDRLLVEHHYLKSSTLVGEALRYVAAVGDRWLALVGWQGQLGEHLSGGVWTIGSCDLHPLSLLFVLSGTLMISKTLRIPKL